MIRFTDAKHSTLKMIVSYKIYGFFFFWTNLNKIYGLIVAIQLLGDIGKPLQDRSMKLFLYKKRG